MLLASWFLVCFFKKFRCFNAKNLGSVGQWAAKLPAIKLSEWLDRDRESNPSRLADWGRGRPADFFLRPPTLTASNFAALWPTDPKFSAIKHLNLLKKHIKNQEASSILKVVFALSKWPHLHRKRGKSITLTEHSCSHNLITCFFYNPIWQIMVILFRRMICTSKDPSKLDWPSALQKFYHSTH